jgi:hypothetical protein
MTLNVDLTDVEAWAGGIITPPFDGLVEVDDAEEGASSGGHPQFMLELRAVEGEQAGSTIRDWIVVTPQSAGRVKQVLEAMGVSNLDGPVAFDAPELIGKRCRIVVREEPYNGEMKTRVKAYQPAGAATNGASSTGAKDDSAKLAF